MKSLKLLIVQETNWIDRNVIHQHQLAERLAQRGHEVRVIDYNILWSEQSEIKRWKPRRLFPAVNRVAAGVALPVLRPAALNFPLVCHAVWSINSLREMYHLHKEYPFDVVIGLSLTNSYPMALLLKRLDIPYVSMVLEPYYTMIPTGWLRPAAQFVERLALQKADHTVVFTPKMSHYVQEMGAASGCLSCLRTGVDLHQFHPDISGQMWRQQLGIPQNSWVLFFMGWLYDFSGLQEIVSAVVADAGLLQDAHLLIVGDGDLYRELTATIQQHKLMDRVIMTGHQPYEAIPGLVAAADVCLLPSLFNDTTRDIVPMKVYEYLAAGKPVVASALPGLQAEFGDESGILYADGPAAVLQQALALANAPAQVEALGKVARNNAEQNADWEKTTDQLAQILTNLVTGERKGLMYE